MSIPHVLGIVGARWRTFLAVFALVLALAGAVTVLMGRQYTATASVLVDIKAPDLVSGQYSSPAQLTPSYMATQVDIIESERVAIRVVRDLKLSENALAVAKWEESGRGKGSLEQFYTDILMRNLDVKPSRESNVIAIRFTNPDAAFAARIANEFARAFIATTVELKADPARDTAGWFDERSQQLRTGLEQAQARLSQYEREHGIVATDDRLDVEIARLNDLNTQLTLAQAQSADSESRKRQASDHSANSPDVLNNVVISTLRSDLARSEAKLQELGQQLGTSHPQFLRARAENDALRRKLAEESQKVASSVGIANTVNRSREAQIRADVETQKRRVLELKAQRDEVAVLHHEVEAAQRAFDLVSQRLSQTSLESQAQQTNVILLSEALAPPKPSQPRVALNLALGGVLGLMFALAVVLGLESRSPRIRSAESVAELLGLPGVVTLPNVRVRA